jgi:hypothetical protein
MNRSHIQSQQVAGAATALRRVARAIAFVPVLISFSALGAEIDLPGTYQLVSASINYLDTGEIIPDIFGKSAKGFIMYGADGRMLALITNDNRPKPESIEKTTDEQRMRYIGRCRPMAGLTNSTERPSSITSIFAGTKFDAVRSWPEISRWMVICWSIRRGPLHFQETAGYPS